MNYKNAIFLGKTLGKNSESFESFCQRYLITCKQLSALQPELMQASTSFPLAPSKKSVVFTFFLPTTHTHRDRPLLYLKTWSISPLAPLFCQSGEKWNRRRGEEEVQFFSPRPTNFMAEALFFSPIWYCWIFLRVFVCGHQISKSQPFSAHATLEAEQRKRRWRRNQIYQRRRPFKGDNGNLKILKREKERMRRRRRLELENRMEISRNPDIRIAKMHFFPIFFLGNQMLENTSFDRCFRTRVLNHLSGIRNSGYREDEEKESGKGVWIKTYRLLLSWIIPHVRVDNFFHQKKKKQKEVGKSIHFESRRRRRKKVLDWWSTIFLSTPDQFFFSPGWRTKMWETWKDRHGSWW